MDNQQMRYGAPDIEERRKLFKDAVGKFKLRFDEIYGKYGLAMRLNEEKGTMTFYCPDLGKEYLIFTEKSGQELERTKIPKEIKADLDRYVIKQDYAKKILATEVASHYQRLMSGINEEGVKTDKRNILLVGPTGVGKSYTVEIIAKTLGAPFIKVDAPDYTAAGYVGGDVDNIVRMLLDAAGGDVAKAEKGIVFVDEVDKIASNKSLSGPDVGGEKTQAALLTLVEGKKVEKVGPHDAATKMEDSQRRVFKQQALMEQKRLSYDDALKKIKEEEGPNTIDTEDVLFIFGGSFMGSDRESLVDIIKKRIGGSAKDTISGFTRSLPSKSSETETYEYLKFVKPEDVIKFGMRPEFVGRIAGIAPLESLNKEDLIKILTKDTEDSLVKQYRVKFKAWGINLNFEGAALYAIAEKAIKLKTGARSLNNIMFDTLFNYEYELSGSDKIKDLLVTQEMVEDSKGDLQKLFSEGDSQKLLNKLNNLQVINL